MQLDMSFTNTVRSLPFVYKAHTKLSITSLVYEVAILCSDLFSS